MESEDLQDVFGGCGFPVMFKRNVAFDFRAGLCQKSGGPCMNAKGVFYTILKTFHLCSFPETNIRLSSRIKCGHIIKMLRAKGPYSCFDVTGLMKTPSEFDSVINDQ